MSVRSWFVLFRSEFGSVFEYSSIELFLPEYFQFGFNKHGLVRILRFL